MLKTEAGRRTLPLGKSLRDHLLDVKAHSSSDYVLSMTDGRSLTKTGMRRLWNIVETRTVGRGAVPRALGEKYGNVTVDLDFRCHPHQLRHTYITQLFESGLDIKQVQYLAGHSTPTMTLRVYTHYRQSQRSAETTRQVESALAYLA